MSLLSSITSLAGGNGSIIKAIIGYITKSEGGIEGLLKKFTENGLGSIVESWIGKGENQSVSPEQLGTVLGADAEGIAKEAGVTKDDLLGKLSGILPNMVDKLTPDGKLGNIDLSDMKGVLGSLGGLDKLGGKGLGGMLGGLFKK